MGVLGHVILCNIHKMLQQLLHHFILAETVNQVNTGIFSADLYDPVYHIEIFIRLYDLVHVEHIGFQACRHFFLGICRFTCHIQNSFPDI